MMPVLPRSMCSSWPRRSGERRQPRPLAEMSLADAVATMYAVADYMQANKIDPLPLTPVDRLEGINEANRKFWNRGKQS